MRLIIRPNFPQTDPRADAAIHAAVSVRLYEKLAPALLAKTASTGKEIPIGWYTYNMMEGEVIRLEKSCRGAVIPWSTRDCSWYGAGKFQGYFP